MDVRSVCDSRSSCSPPDYIASRLSNWVNMLLKQKSSLGWRDRSSVQVWTVLERDRGWAKVSGLCDPVGYMQRTTVSCHLVSFSSLVKYFPSCIRSCYVFYLFYNMTREYFSWFCSEKSIKSPESLIFRLQAERTVWKLSWPRLWIINLSEVWHTLYVSVNDVLLVQIV